MPKWIKSTHPGVRYREHPTRKFNRQKDKYFEIRYQRDGKTISEALGWLSEGMNASEASALRGHILQNIRKGITPQSVAEMREMKAAADAEQQEAEQAEQRANFTFGQAAEIFIEWARDNKRSSEQDELRYEKYLKKKFGTTPIINISPFHLEKLKMSLKKAGLSPGTITQYLQLMRVIYNRTRDWGYHDCHFPKVKFPKANSQRVAFLTQGQAKVLLDTIKGKSLQLWCQCVLSLYAGLRFGEIAALELRDLNYESGTMHIRDPKSGIDRHAYITEPIKQALDEWWSVSEKKPGLVFPKRQYNKGTHELRQPRVSPVFHRTVDELGFNDGVTDDRHKIVFHTLRHSFASWLMMGGESLQTVKELMGHRDITTTMRYSHLAPDIKRSAVNGLVKTLAVGSVEPDNQEAQNQK